MNLEFCGCVKFVRRLQSSHLTLFPQGKPRAQASLATVELVMKVTQNCWRSFTSVRISGANKPFTPFVGHADRAPIGNHLEAKKNQDQLDILSERDETLGSAVQSGLKRTRSWRVPPNWSRDDWLEELTAVETSATRQAGGEFDHPSGRGLQDRSRAKLVRRLPKRDPPDPLSAGQPACEWFARTTETTCHENLSEKVPIGSSNPNICVRLSCAFAASASRLPRRLLNKPKHRPRRRHALE